jgi:hypothetical protein
MGKGIFDPFAITDDVISSFLKLLPWFLGKYTTFVLTQLFPFYLLSCIFSSFKCPQIGIFKNYFFVAQQFSPWCEVGFNGTIQFTFFQKLTLVLQGEWVVGQQE